MENNTSLQQRLLEAGVRRSPEEEMESEDAALYFKKKGIHIIDLNKTVEGLQGGQR